MIVGPPRGLWGQLYGVYNAQEKCSVNVTSPSSPSPGGSSESQGRPVALPEAQSPPLNDEGLEGMGVTGPQGLREARVPLPSQRKVMVLPRLDSQSTAPEGKRARGGLEGA